VLKAGRPVGEIPEAHVPEWVKRTVHVSPVASNDLRVPWQSGRARVIGLIRGQIVTEALVEELAVENGHAVADPARDLAKIAVLERHLGTGRLALGFVRGFGIERGAFGATLSHDAHNVIVVGVDDGAMARSVGRLRELGGGIVVVEEQGVRAELPLPVAGLLSDRPLAEVLEASRGINAAARALGVTFPAPFQTLAFLALSVIPSLKITDQGLVDVNRFELVPLAV
jgi:adenine deaminase